MGTEVIEQDGTRANQVEAPEETKPQLKARRVPTCSPEDVYAGVTEVLTEIRKERKRPLFALVSKSIDEATLEEIYRWKPDLRGIGIDTPVDILIHSPGGGLTTCYMVARLFSRYTNEWQALVPSMAASGATLICLGSSNIVMSEISQLGPLDPQVISKRRGKFFATERQSPLEAFEAVQYFREFSVASLDAVMKFLLQRAVAPEKAIEVAKDLSIALVKPILEKIEPFDLGAFSLDSRLAVSYCRRIGNPPDQQKKTQRKVVDKSLVEWYPAHEFAIDLAEAAALGFNVCEPTNEIDELFDVLRPYLPGIETYIGLIPAENRDKP